MISGNSRRLEAGSLDGFFVDTSKGESLDIGLAGRQILLDLILLEKPQPWGLLDLMNGLYKRSHERESGRKRIVSPERDSSSSATEECRGL